MNDLPVCANPLRKTKACSLRITNISQRQMRQLGRVRPFPGIKLRISWRNGPRRYPQDGVEGIHRIETTIETEYEFVEVGLQMARLYPSMMCAVDPCLQVGEDKMDHRQVLLCLLRIAPKGKRIVPISHSSNVIISLPSVSANDGGRCYIVFDECCERIGIAARKWNICLFAARNDAEPKAPGVSKLLDRDAAFMGIFPFRTTILGILARPNLNGANYSRLMMSAPSFAPRATANAAFVYFDGMWRANGITVWSHHTGAEFVKHRERRLIRSNIKLALKLDGGLTRRLCRHEIGTPKPSRERHMARLHDRPGSERRILFARTAAQYDRGARCKTIRLASVSALRASKAVRPADCLQITGASTIVRKDALKFRKARWEGC